MAEEHVVLPGSLQFPTLYSTPLSSLGKFETSRQLDRKQSTNQFRKVQEIREIQTKHFQFRIPYKMSATSG